MKDSLLPFNKLTPAEAERLALLAEECGECVQAIGKILRHGYENFSPFDMSATTNREALERECGDIYHAITRLCDDGDLSNGEIRKREREKIKSVLPYLHHQQGEK